MWSVWTLVNENWYFHWKYTNWSCSARSVAGGQKHISVENTVTYFPGSHTHDPSFWNSAKKKSRPGETSFHCIASVLVWHHGLSQSIAISASWSSIHAYSLNLIPIPPKPEVKLMYLIPVRFLSLYSIYQGLLEQRRKLRVTSEVRWSMEE